MRSVKRELERERKKIERELEEAKKSNVYCKPAE